MNTLEKAQSKLERIRNEQKVVLEIDNNGNFYISPYYPAYSDEDKKIIEELLK